MTHRVRDIAWESAVVVRLPSLDETIDALRERFDLPRKPNGIPPHITAIVPFLPAADLTEAGALPALRSLCAAFEPFQVAFAATARFPNVLYLAPQPAEPFIALTRAIVDRWPLIRPYAGAHKAVAPHLTVTTSKRRELFGSVSEALEPQLPLSATVDGAQVYVFAGERWTEHAALPFGPSS
jgi:2'-5' RNA ligase